MPNLTLQSPDAMLAARVGTGVGVALNLALRVLAGGAGYYIAKQRGSDMAGTAAWTVGSVILPGLVLPIGVIIAARKGRGRKR